KPAQGLVHVLDLGRRGEIVADEPAPFLEVGGAAEVDGVVLQRLPLHEQAVTRRLLLGARQRHGAAALRALEQRHRLLHRRLEGGLAAGLDVDLGDFKDHADATFTETAGRRAHYGRRARMRKGWAPPTVQRAKAMMLTGVRPRSRPAATRCAALRADVAR